MFLDNEKQTKNIYLVCGIVHKNVELKNNERSINGTRKENFTASRDAFFFLQGKDFPLETVAGAFKAKKKTDGGSCTFLRLFLART